MATRKVAFEIAGVVVGALTVQIKINESMLPFLESNGYSGTELHNYLEARVQDAVLAMDGSVPGVVVSNLENL